MKEFLKEAANVKPSERQLAWFDTEKYLFCHFGMNTFTGREWGEGTEDESLFNLKNLDCDQWVEAAKAGGFAGIILTAKHHDGFCLWPSKYTEHSVKNSPFKGDIVKACSDACRRGGIKFGFYLSPWDRNSKYYGTPEYNDYFCNQLTELLTGYGEIFCIWFDGACGEGPNGKVQIYDFERYFKLIRKYQPNAAIFNDNGPDTRWCGNEAGKGRAAEWSVVPSELCKFAEVQTCKGPMADYGDLKGIYNSWDDIGSIEKVIWSKGLCYCPSEVDTSIRPGWFWHEKEQPKSLEKLFDIYLSSVGNNACLNLNVPPNKDGRFSDSDVERLKEFGDLIKKSFSDEKDVELTYLEGQSPYQPKIKISCKNREDAPIKYLVLEEDIKQGQRVENFLLRSNGPYTEFYFGGCIGHKKIIDVSDKNLLDMELDIISSRDVPIFKSIKVY